MPEAESYRYAAFISYRHVEPDRRWAKWLHRALETYRVPKKQQEASGLPARVGRVFRDEEELSASSDLSNEIEAALQQSKFLIVVCSPRTPVSEWVNQEIVQFREMGRDDRILALLVEGEPSESFPASLREIRRKVVEEGGKARETVEEVEPLAADVRPSTHEHGGHSRRMARLRLLSCVLGCRFDDLRRREEQRRRRMVIAAGSALLALVIVLTGLSVFAFRQEARADAKAREADEERSRATEERDAKAQALAEVLRLADAKKVRDLLKEVGGLWPLHPSKADGMKAWIERAEDVIANLRMHKEALAQLRGKALSTDEAEDWTFDTPAEDWQHQVLAGIVGDIESLAEPEDGALARVRWRHEFVTNLRKRSIEDHAEPWAETIKAIQESESYGGLRIRPQLGLVPLGPDPDSGLFEFAHLGSGSIPKRDAETRQPVYKEDAAIVVVLIPGGTFLMGAQKEDEARPNYDPHAQTDERPVHRVTLSPYFLAKHECTQAQWAALTGGLEPSASKAGGGWGEKVVTPRNPVERISWEDCAGEPGWLVRNRLRLPSEAQWEYACRAGTNTPWFVGLTVAGLGKVANIGDAYLLGKGDQVALSEVTPEVNDGHLVHAPAGSFESNAFGLFDVHGNVWEWCADAWHPDYLGAPEDGGAWSALSEDGIRVQRGGCWTDAAWLVRSAIRPGNDPGYRSAGLGVRPARAITSD